MGNEENYGSISKALEIYRNITEHIENIEGIGIYETIQKIIKMTMGNKKNMEVDGNY